MSNKSPEIDCNHDNTFFEYGNEVCKDCGFIVEYGSHLSGGQ